MFINQIFITDDETEALPPYLRFATSSINSLIPHATHKIWRKEELRQWIKNEYGTSFLNAFDKLVPYSYKSDLARYLLLYKFGGWYFDISIRVLTPITVNDGVDLVVFSDIQRNTGVSYACCGSIIFSKPKNEIIKETIITILNNIQNQYYGRNSLYPTGPLCLGKNVANCKDNQKIITGEFTELTPGFSNKNRAYIFNDGSIFALHKPGEDKGGNIAYLGVNGSNDYGALYNERKIYDLSIDLVDKAFDF
jgi:mannosyltransferase OCH1-like enzyme